MPAGLAHGRRFAREIADNVATYLARFAASGLDRDQAFAEAVKWRRAIETLSPVYGEEMRGIAEGSGQSADTIALLNARYELAFTPPAAPRYPRSTASATWSPPVT
jgi:isopenicillin-N N-acyltransferase-like protein